MHAVRCANCVGCTRKSDQRFLDRSLVPLMVEDVTISDWMLEIGPVAIAIDYEREDLVTNGLGASGPTPTHGAGGNPVIMTPDMAGRRTSKSWP